MEGVPELLKTPGLLLNMNIPRPRRGGLRTFRVTRLGHRVYTDVISEKIDPRGRTYYWIAGKPTWKREPDTDHAAVEEGYVSVTPLKMDYTNYDLLEQMRGWTLRRPGRRSRK